MNVGDVGKSCTRWRSTARQIVSGRRSGTVTTQPAFDRLYSSVLNPPIWSNSRNVIVRSVCRGTVNFSSIGTMSCTAALLFPVEPDENRISPGEPARFRRSNSSCSAVRPVLHARKESSAPISTTASTSAISRNSGFFSSTELVSGTSTALRSIRASNSATARGEKSASTAVTAPWGTPDRSSELASASISLSSQP